MAPNSNALKISHLLAQFLYENRRLDLPGIGRLTLDSSVIIEPPKGKHSKPVELEGVHFVQDLHTEEDPELIAYISTHSGKIKALASADLYSHLELARQFLNIGKPFLFEGIGSLNKTSSGEFVFTAGTALHEKTETVSTHAAQREAPAEEPADSYRGLLYVRKEKKSLPRPVIVLLIILGIIAAVWGGYKLYKRSTGSRQQKEETTPAVQPAAGSNAAAVPATDTTHLQDTSRLQPAPQPTAADSLAPAVNYKIHLETAEKERALSRYGKLKSWGWDIQMETKDSLTFVLFLRKDMRPVDTARVVDSLSRAYGRRAFIVN